MAKAVVKDHIRIGIVDANNLFRKGLVQLFIQNERRFNYIMVFDAADGEEMITSIQTQVLPDIILMDIVMPEADGFETVKWIRRAYPGIRILILSTDTRQSSIVRVLRSGAHGYLSKDISLDELFKAIAVVREKGHYLSEEFTGLLLDSFSKPGMFGDERELSARERDFLKWACTDLSYQEIATRMYVSPKTVDGYRQQLFEKFDVKSRVGLAMYAVRSGLVKV
jgi:two-component system, NarL family, invasion response regulator UvrY